MRNNKWVTRALGATVVIVWTLVAYRIAAPVADEEGAMGNPEQTLLTHDGPGRKPYEYMSDVRDPFSFGKAKLQVRMRPDSMRVFKAEPPPAPFRLTGIMTRTKRNTAVLEGSGGSVHFLAEGDTLSGIRILRIKAQEVTYLFRKKQCTWSLQ